MGGVTTGREVEMTENSEHLLYAMILIMIINQSLHHLHCVIEQVRNGALAFQLETCIHIVNSRAEHRVTYGSF